MNHQPQFYKESGNYKPAFLVITILGLIVISLILAYVYSAISTYMPFIYINALLLIGLGVVIGYATLISCKLSAIRNSSIRIGLAVATGILTWYFQWTLYLLYLTEESLPSFMEYLLNIGWVFYDSELWDVFFYYNRNGGYDVGPIPVVGGLLIVVWFIEMLVIIGAPIVATLNYSPLPYSDTFQKWYDKFTLRKQFRKLSNSNRTHELLSENVFEALQELDSGRANSHSIIHIFYLPEENSHYLQVENAFLDTSGKESKMKTEITINNIKINTSDAHSILKHFDHKKQGFQLM